MKNIIFASVGLRPALGALALALLAAPVMSPAQDYLGANVVLRQVEERNVLPLKKPIKTDETAQLRQDLKSFRESGTNLAPAVAAARWLELVDRAVKIQQANEANRDPDSVTRPIEPDDLLGALPPPQTWGELSKAVAARPAPKKGAAEMRSLGLRFLGATLTGDDAERKKVIADLQTRARQANEQSAYFFRNFLNQLSEAMLAISDDPDVVIKSLEREMAQAGSSNPQNLRVPNLLPQLGREKTEAFLRKALVTPNVLLEFPRPNETSRLAQSLALQLIDQLKSPQWSLVNSLDAVKLYEALDKHFGPPTNTVSSSPDLPDADIVNGPPRLDDFDSARGVARIYYMLGLISQDRAKDAVAVAKKLGSRDEYYYEGAFKAMEQNGYTAALDTFFYELLSQDPTLSFWDKYVDLAAKAGRTDRMLALVQTNLAREDFSGGKKAALHQILFKAQLAADNVDDGVQEIRRLMALDFHSQPGRDLETNPGQLAIRLARLGLLTQKPEWTDEGIAAARKWLTNQTNNDENSNAGDVRDSLADILVELKRGPEAESLLTDALAGAARTGKKREYDYYDRSSGENVLANLAELYDQAGRQTDVLVLLDQSPNWGVKDLSELFQSTSRLGPNIPLPVPCLAASALLAEGQKERARKIIYELLNRNPGLDRGYELLLELDGTNAIPKLDELFAHDQFEERPLIWKGHLLRQQQGRLDEAEKVIRQAVAIDPSDGDEGKNDRMRVYAELAEIRQARGDIKDADFYREIVKAIRLSENADDFYAAGLLKRAIAMYETALGHFSDAYCIQSRLAIQMSDMGLQAQAEEHYRRAYELMPDSFGRVESHCFGCERAFDGERPQNIAEQVFTKMVAERPDKPQIHYLLGYLRQEQERLSEARTNYLAAVRLDPQYLNAWVKLHEVSESLLVSAKDRDAISFSILRLDPLGRHTSGDFARVSDLPALWHAVADAASQSPVPATDLFPLPASTAALEKKKNSSDENSTKVMMDAEREQMEDMIWERSHPSPAAAIAQNAFVSLAGQMFLGSNYSLDDE